MTNPFSKKQHAYKHNTLHIHTINYTKKETIIHLRLTLSLVLKLNCHVVIKKIGLKLFIFDMDQT